MLQGTTSSTWVRGLLETLAGRGVDARTLLREIGIERMALEDDTLRLTSDKVSLLWRRAVELSGDAGLGVHLANTARPAQYGIAGYAMMSSPDLRTGIERLIRYLRLVSDAVVIDVETVPEGGRVRLAMFGGDLDVPRQRIEYAILMLLSLCRWMMGGVLNPVAASFSFTWPDDISVYAEALDCPLTFDASHASFTLAANDLASPLPTAMPALATLHERMARLGLDRLEAPEITLRVQDAIQRRLHDGTPLRAQIASDLHVSDRTLQRRLAEENTSFETVVDETRRRLAEQYLAEGESSPLQIAFVLGYADQRSYFRACARWFGQTPGSLRDHVERSSHPPIGVAPLLKSS